MPSSEHFSNRQQKIRVLFDQYIEFYSSRDDRLIALFSEDFCGYTAGGTVLIKKRDEWINSIRQDFAEMPESIQIELQDYSQQDLSEHTVVVSVLFKIQLPFPEHILSREMVRQVLIFRFEGDAWKIVHSGTSIPYYLVQHDEIFPLNTLAERNRTLEALVEERTRELNEREAFYRLLTEDTMDVIWRTDSEHRITYISPADEHYRGYKAEEVIGHHVCDLFTEEGKVIATELFNKQPQIKLAESSEFVSFEVPHRCKDGGVLWGEVFSKAVLDEQGRVTAYHGITREITKRKQLQDQIRQLAFYDALTQLPNRRLLMDRLNQAQAASKRTGHHGALMFVDLDNFKPLNDQHGHFAGDLLLIEVAERLKNCIRKMDSVARFGGDEFIVLLGELATDYEQSIADAKAVAEKIRVRLSDEYRLKITRSGDTKQVVEHRCSASIGIFVFLADEVCVDDILKYADQAMYKAKAAGRNTISCYVTDE